MTDDELDALKREHNALLADGAPLYERITAIYERVSEIRQIMRTHDPDAAIECIFTGTMTVDKEPT